MNKHRQMGGRTKEKKKKKSPSATKVSFLVVCHVYMYGLHRTYLCMEYRCLPTFRQFRVQQAEAARQNSAVLW